MYVVNSFVVLFSNSVILSRQSLRIEYIYRFTYTTHTQLILLRDVSPKDTQNQEKIFNYSFGLRSFDG